ncbi:hypothetical protein A2U01_0092812, partial [Trifolium medium]|nr:hypothetical protein [Trifolium medium]
MHKHEIERGRYTRERYSRRDRERAIDGGPTICSGGGGNISLPSSSFFCFFLFVVVLFEGDGYSFG